MPSPPTTFLAERLSPPGPYRADCPHCGAGAQGRLVDVLHWLEHHLRNAPCHPRSRHSA